MKLLKIASFLVFGLLALTSGVRAVEPAHFTNEIQDLRAASHAIIIGSIERRNIAVAETVAQVRVVQAFSGSLKEGQLITFKTRAGRVQVQPNEPELTGVDRAVFYLHLEADGSYRCAHDYYGFKPIVNDNVYTNPQNPLETVKLKKYQESLVAVLQPNPKAS